MWQSRLAMQHGIAFVLLVSVAGCSTQPAQVLITEPGQILRITDRGDAHNPSGAYMFKSPDVGAVVDLVRRDGMSRPVPGQEYDRCFAKLSVGQGSRRFSVWRMNHFLADDLQGGKLSEPGPADYG